MLDLLSWKFLIILLERALYQSPVLSKKLWSFFHIGSSLSQDKNERQLKENSTEEAKVLIGHGRMEYNQFRPQHNEF
jgi:hypothetical protein